MRVDALVTDLAINVTNAELFIDTVGAPGTGLAMMSKDGAFNELGEDVYQTISQAQANALTAGAHTIIVRGKDAAGNWGATAAYTLISDKVKPTISGLSAVPNPTNTTNTSTTSFTLSATANGTGTNVIQAEWFEGADPGLGKGNQFIFTQAASVNLSASIDYVAIGWTPGSHTVNVRAKDAAINWSTTASVVVNVVYPNNVFADGFETGSFSAWSATGGTAGRISVSNVSPQAGTYRMAAQISAGASGYVQDNTPFVDRSYHAALLLQPEWIYHRKRRQPNCGDHLQRVEFGQCNGIPGPVPAQHEYRLPGAPGRDQGRRHDFHQLVHHHQQRLERHRD